MSVQDIFLPLLSSAVATAPATGAQPVGLNGTALMRQAYWVFFIIFAITAIIFATLTFMKPPGRRLHGCASVVLGTEAAVLFEHDRRTAIQTIC